MNMVKFTEADKINSFDSLILSRQEGKVYSADFTNGQGKYISKVFASAGGFIVLADKKVDHIDVFSSLLKTFIDEKDKLLRNKDGDYQFHHERIGGRVVLKEDSSLEMNLLGTVRW